MLGGSNLASFFLHGFLELFSCLFEILVQTFQVGRGFLENHFGFGLHMLGLLDGFLFMSDSFGVSKCFLVFSMDLFGSLKCLVSVLHDFLRFLNVLLSLLEITISFLLDSLGSTLQPRGSLVEQFLAHSGSRVVFLLNDFSSFSISLVELSLNINLGKFFGH